MIQEKTTEDLRHMTNEEGLILQGCGGDLQEWVDGINDLLTQEGILLNGTKFEHAATFQHDGLTNLMFSFEGVQLNVGKLALWRIQTHSQFGGTWLSDYVPNRLGGFIQEQKLIKPKMELLGRDGNIFSIKASELRDSSCLIIDEIGHCAFDKENTRLFFDLIDRRYNKEGSFNMIFTSNKNPALWREDFEEDATLLCTLDRIFDDATVFKLRGESFRGKKLETVSLQTGKIPAVESVMAKE